jgi:hypothetical protein
MIRAATVARRTRIWACFGVVAILVLPVLGCSGGDEAGAGETETRAEAEKPIEGSFVGKVSGTKAFIAVVAAPAEENEDKRGVQVFISDGRRLSEWFSDTIQANSFAAESADSDAEARGDLSEDSVAGSVELADGKTVEYTARRPAGAAGLYDVTISRAGELSGASAAGLGVTGEVTLRKQGSGMLKLADGERIKFDVTRGPAGDLIRLRAGQVRLIVLPGGELRGAGKSGSPAGGGDSDFFIRSSSA